MNTPLKKDSRSLHVLMAVFIIVGTGIIAAGYFYYLDYRNRYQTEVERRLTAISEMKVSELVNWRKERLGDASGFYGNEAFASLVRRYFLNPAAPEVQRQLWIWLSKIQVFYSYDLVLLLDARSVPRMSVPDTKEPVSADTLQYAGIVMRSGQIHFQDFYRDGHNQRIYLSIMVPILDFQNNNKALGILVLRIDPEKFLYPFLNSWPIPSRTAETLIARREGDEVLFLNELRFQKDTALKLRFPLTNKELPPVKAILGQEGVVEGRDYRGVPVIAAVRAIPDSPWFLSARMDKEELYAPLQQRLWLMIALVGVLLMGAGAGAVLIWRRQSLRFYRDQYETAAALRENEERFRTIFERSTVGKSLTATDGRLLKINHAFADMLGYTTGEMEKMSFAEITHPDDIPASRECIRSVLAGERTVYRLDKRYLHKSGRIIHADVSTTLFRDADGSPLYLITSVMDITDRITTDEALLRKNNLLAAMSDIFKEALISKTSDDVARLCLTLAQKLTDSNIGFIGEINSSGRFDTIALTDPGWGKCVIPKTDAAVMIRNMEIRGIWGQVIRSGAALIANHPGTHPDSVGLPAGHPPLTSFLGVPLVHSGRTIGMISLANKEHDYTPDDQEMVANLSIAFIEALMRKRAEEALREREEDLQVKNAELERFTYTISHDLKSPLVTVKTFLGYLEKDLAEADAGRIEQDINFIRTAADKMGLLLEELLEMSRIGRVVNPAVNITLGELVNDALNAVAGRIAEKGVAVQVSDETFTLYGDRSRLAEIWQNLVENAVKFMGDQQAPRIEIGVERQEQDTVFYVRDNGMGIDPRHQARAFNLFEKLDPKSDGTGIGLSLVKQIVEIYKGTIWLESEGIGRGTSFRFTLPGAIKIFDKNAEALDTKRGE